ncbi:Translation initiation factor 1 [Candidatus Vidania fulgoroideae]|nr:Translation initiation factor 1 [Candidatus Vidania fulgoroideae]UOQ38089.1 Translation initiation factor 1 [Candidatus Vidania fulgoroideae]
MKKKKKILDGVILRNLPNTTFLVEISKIKKNIICYMSGKMRLNFIRLIYGDKVKVEFNKKDFSKGRIVYRTK